MSEKRKLTIEDIVFNDKILKPNEITDDIINNIREIKIDGWTDAQVKLLNSVIRETLICVRDNNENVEYALVYDLNMYCNQNGEWLFQVRGENDTAQVALGKNSDVMHLLSDQIEEHIIIISHNHNNNRIISLVDLMTLVSDANIKLIVAITNSGKISYILKKDFDLFRFNQIKKEIVQELKDVNFNGYDDRYDNYLYRLLNKSSEYGVEFYKEGHNYE